jgi:hypothetical protein
MVRPESGGGGAVGDSVSVRPASGQHGRTATHARCNLLLQICSSSGLLVAVAT